MQFRSIDPFSGNEVGAYKTLSNQELGDRLDASVLAFSKWKKVALDGRCEMILKVADLLKGGVEEYAVMITKEMGKPITESRAEVLKCVWVCEYYAKHAHSFLAPEMIESDASSSYVRHDPLGGVLAIMPWNFPFWQVFRFAVPTLLAGNVGLLKHASNVIGCAKLIEELFAKAGFPVGVFQNLIVEHEQIETIVSFPGVQAVTLTGSEKAGSAVAALAGKYLKKSLLELGGSNSFIVWSDADIDQAVAIGVKARMLNGGQSCIAAKRFVLLDEIYDEFVQKYVEAVKTLLTGNPMLVSTDIGPLARIDLANKLNVQVQDSIAQGALLLYGGKHEGCFYEPTVLGNVTPEMPVFKEETFGPVAVMVKATDVKNAFTLAECSKFGLGVTLCTKDIEKARSMAGEVSDGAYFVNEMVKSDPRLPFGGSKFSGYGRELSKDGIREFVNRKTVYVK